jgi:BlaI family transcriptional regulator, penicillinase repressor
MAMEQVKLFDSEIKLMELIWNNSPITAKELTKLAELQIGWNKNTTYTVLKKLVEKKSVNRAEPNFLCTPLITREQVLHNETKDLINKLYNGSKKAFFSAFFSKEKLTPGEIEELKHIIEKSGDGDGDGDN